MTAKPERALIATRTAQDLFAQYVAQVRREITRARMLHDDEPRAAMLEGALQVAQRDMENLELELGALLLSSQVTEQVVNSLSSSAEQAKELLEEMKDTSDFLTKVAEGANLISSVLKTVAKVV